MILAPHRLRSLLWPLLLSLVPVSLHGLEMVLTLSSACGLESGDATRACHRAATPQPGRAETAARRGGSDVTLPVAGAHAASSSDPVPELDSVLLLICECGRGDAAAQGTALLGIQSRIGAPAGALYIDAVVGRYMELRVALRVDARGGRFVVHTVWRVRIARARA